MSRFISLGRIVKPKGLRGELKVKLLSGDIPLPEPIYLSLPGRREPATVERLRPEGEGYCLKLRGVETIEAAEMWRDASIEVEEDRLPPAPPGKFYHFQLVGCAVADEAGHSIGTVESVEQLPTCDTLWVSRSAGEPLPVPMVKSVVLGVDLAARKVTVAAASLEESAAGG